LKHYVEERIAKKSYKPWIQEEKHKAQAIMEQGIFDLNLLGSNQYGKE
jgi:hypothetical protein